MSPAREAAFDILRAVENGGFASDLLLTRTAGLDTRDAGLASELVFGVLRRQGQLDWIVGQLAGRPVARLDPEVRIALRMGLYQLRHLDRVPAHAAVAESVEAVKRARKKSAAGLVNAVLRRAAPRDEAAAPTAWPDRATELSMPGWLLDGWEREFGAESAGRIAAEFLEAPKTWIRVPPGAVAPAGAVASATVSGCYRVESLGGGGSAGTFRCQDVGSQSVVPLLALAPGHKFLDLCAAPGNKTAQALETPLLGLAVSCDSSFRRAAAMLRGGLVSGPALNLTTAPSRSRLRYASEPRALASCAVVVADGTRPLPFRVLFDRILVDAPCSGTGTMGRNPEIRWRLKPEALAELHQRQVALLAVALEQVAPGGRVVYSTCSLERAENEDVVEEALARRPEFHVVERLRRLPGRDEGDGFFAVALER